MRNRLKPFLAMFLIGSFGGLMIAINPVRTSSAASVGARSAISQSPAASPEFREGMTVERELKGGETHSYPFTIQAGQFLEISVEPRGISLSVRFVGADGKPVWDTDLPGQVLKPQGYGQIFSEGGNFTLEIVALKKTAVSGRYELKVTALRAPTEEEKTAREIEDLLEEATRLLTTAQYDSGLTSALRALEKSEKTFGADELLTAHCFGLLARLYRAKGDFSKAESFYQQSLAVKEKIQGSNHPEVANEMNNLAVLYRDMAEYAKAKALHQQILAVKEKIFGADSPELAVNLNNLAVLYLDTGNYGRAEALFKQALALREKAFGPEHPDVAGSLNNLAALYRNKAEYSRAEALFLRAEAIWEKVLGPEHPNTAAALNNLAEMYRIQGDFPRSEALHQRVLEIKQKVLGENHPDVARSLYNYAKVVRDDARAEAMYQRTIAIWEKTGGSERSEVADCVQNLADLYRKRRDFAQAETFLQRALSIRAKALGPDHPSVAAALNGLGLIRQAKGEYAQAETFYRQALAIQRKALRGDHPDVAGSLKNLACLFQAEADARQALTFSTECNEALESDLNRNLVSGSERQKLLYLNTTQKILDQTISLHVQNAPENAAAARVALTVILRRKGRALDAMTSGIEMLRRQAAPEDQILLEKLSDAKQQLATVTLRGPGRDGVGAYQAKLKDLTEKVERVEAEVSARSGQYQIQTRPITLEAIQKAVPPGAALVEYATYQPFDAKTGTYGPLRYVVYVLSDQGDPKWADLGEAAAIDRAATDFRQVLGTKSPSGADSKSALSKDAGTLARSLYQSVMLPVVKLAPNASRLLMSPDGALNVLPFAALIDERGAFLVTRRRLTYLTSGRDLLRLQTKFESGAPPLAVVDPDYGVGRGPELGGQAFQPLFRLIATGAEGTEIHRLYPNSTLKIRSDATKQAVLEARRPQILHLATHGLFLPDAEPAAEIGPEGNRNLTPIKVRTTDAEPSRSDSPLLRSALFFAGANNESGTATLTALEAAQLDLWGTKLVVLSACETGVGQVRNGDGVYGLRRALVLAGSESQVISLWKVSDRGTKELMTGLYRRLKAGEGRADALQNTQLEMLRSAKWKNPFHWAAFIQSGEWAALDGKR